MSYYGNESTSFGSSNVALVTPVVSSPTLVTVNATIPSQVVSPQITDAPEASENAPTALVIQADGDFDWRAEIEEVKGEMNHALMARIVGILVNVEDEKEAEVVIVVAEEKTKKAEVKKVGIQEKSKEVNIVKEKMDVEAQKEEMIKGFMAQNTHVPA
ncbi:hypothetical protein L1987_78760 [Smallanthus sonchifolius]|uniref:Uncharacterized protein n=1 Tax=Smallanthus sonchifolius TaxID=185202 RepID=A0ACB8ZEM7_9ASTR|nr:hypothetical protein L1987_78760 [Smallanthus sonchifolius]